MRGDVAKRRATGEIPVAPQAGWIGYPRLDPPACSLLPCELSAENPAAQVLNGLEQERGTPVQKIGLPRRSME